MVLLFQMDSDDDLDVMWAMLRFFTFVSINMTYRISSLRR